MKTEKILPVWFYFLLSVFVYNWKKKKLKYYLFWGVFFMWTIHLSTTQVWFVQWRLMSVSHFGFLDEYFLLFFWPIRLCFRLLTYVNGWGFVNRKSTHIALKHNSGRNCVCDAHVGYLHQTIPDALVAGLVFQSCVHIIALLLIWAVNNLRNWRKKHIVFQYIF